MLYLNADDSFIINTIRSWRNYWFWWWCSSCSSWLSIPTI